VGELGVVDEQDRGHAGLEGPAQQRVEVAQHAFDQAALAALHLRRGVHSGPIAAVVGRQLPPCRARLPHRLQQAGEGDEVGGDVGQQRSPGAQGLGAASAPSLLAVQGVEVRQQVALDGGGERAGRGVVLAQRIRQPNAPPEERHGGGGVPGARGRVDEQVLALHAQEAGPIALGVAATLRHHPSVELLHQPRLAQAGLGQQHRHARSAAVADLHPEAFEFGQFGLATAERAGGVGHATRYDGRAHEAGRSRRSLHEEPSGCLHSPCPNEYPGRPSKS
jgi:hypothetical protein